MMECKKIISFALAAFLVFGLMGLAVASDFPTKPIKVYVGFSPGGGTDIVARTVASVVPEFLGQSMVIINKTGAAGTVAAREVSQAKPDGYTLLVAGGSETVSVGHYRELPYHPINAFAPIIRISRDRMILNFMLTRRGKRSRNSLKMLRRMPASTSMHLPATGVYIIRPCWPFAIGQGLR